MIREKAVNPKAIVGVLTRFPDKAESVPMVKRMKYTHTVYIGKRVKEFRNPSQIRCHGMIVWAREICIDVKRTLRSTLS